MMSFLTGLVLDTLQLALILFGFGLVIVIHELGHFVAARWAGVRVLAFAVGFGKPIFSYRPGLGWRRGSSEPEAHALRSDSGVSPTEYRLNALPLGGYVKMLGQDDADPGHRSDEPDSYNSAPVWKRLIIISAGVVFNVISAAALFVVVFLIGMRVAPPVIGEVALGQPAALAEPEAGGGVGLRRGDRIIRIDGESARSFNDIAIGVAMSDPRRGVRVVVDRPGEGELAYRVMPEADPDTDMLSIGVGSNLSGAVVTPTSEKERAQFERIAAAGGAAGLEPGARLVRVNGGEVDGALRIIEAASMAPGEAVRVELEGSGGLAEYVIETEPMLPTDVVRLGSGAYREIVHIAGLRPVLGVSDVTSDRAREAGLRAGDVFAVLGDVEFPSVGEGIREIRSHRNQDLPAVVLRAGEEVPLTLPVSGDGTVGFSTRPAQGALLASAPSGLLDARTREPVGELAGRVIQHPGSRVRAINGEAVESWNGLVVALQRLAQGAPGASAIAELELELPLPVDEGGERAVERVTLELSERELERLRAMRWSSPSFVALFEPVTMLLRAEGPIGAVSLGFHETRRVMLSTYLTFVRLFQGSIRVERLSGPIGIVHIGTVFADRGVVWVLFFFGLVSINLAVINFLPVPITDGGHVVFLLWEQMTGKPVSILVQNIAALAGLAVIGAVFLVVTYNDILRLLGLGA